MTLLDAAQGALIDLEERIEAAYSFAPMSELAKKNYEREMRSLQPLRDALQKERVHLDLTPLAGKI